MGLKLTSVIVGPYRGSPSRLPPRGSLLTIASAEIRNGTERVRGTLGARAPRI
jgi:hypothetical protein